MPGEYVCLESMCVRGSNSWKQITLAGDPNFGVVWEDTGIPLPQELRICCRWSSRRGESPTVWRSQETAALEEFGTVVL